MGFRLPRVVSAKQLLRRSYSNGNQAASALAADVPKGYLAVYVVGAESNMKRFVIPVSFLNQPSFQELLSQAEEEFGFDHPMGGLTIPCTEDYFIDLISCLNMTREMRLYVQHIDFGAVIIHDTIFGFLSSSLEDAELKADLLKQFLSTYKFRPIIPSTVASLQNKRVMRMERENTSYHRYAIDLCFLPK